MASKIEWTDETWNPTLGCDKVSRGCDGCYAIRTAAMRQANPHPRIASAFAGLVERDESGRLDWTGLVRTLPARLEHPLRWRRPRMVFVDSQSDLFHAKVPDEFIAQVWAVMALTPQHTYQILTKRHARPRSLLSSPRWVQLVLAALTELLDLVDAPIPAERLDAAHAWASSPELALDPLTPLPNVWLGASVEDQKAAELRIPPLLETPAAVRFLSCEPLLGPVDLGPWTVPGSVIPASGYGPSVVVPRIPGLQWVIAGGESGPDARPMHPDWPRQLRDQCTRAGVAYFFKQWGEFRPAPWCGEGGATHAVQAGTGQLLKLGHSPTSLERSSTAPAPWSGLLRPGKHDAGRELDGRTWDEYPEPRRRHLPVGVPG